MPAVAPFHSINELDKPAHLRVHHDNSACPSGRDIPENEGKKEPGALGAAKTVT